MVDTSSSIASVLGTRADLSKDNYSFLQQYIHRESGIQIGEDKLYLVQSGLVPVADREGLKSLDELCTRLRTFPSPQLRRSVVEAMTTHETLFFRDPQVFESLRSAILPELIQKNRATRRMRIWSAACSSGQETYSLAMTLFEMGCGDWNIEILGSDISDQILERARQGRYLQIEMNRGLPAAMLVKYFQRAGLDWQVKDSLRSWVRFQNFDLRMTMAPLGSFDLVLCRNVMIYFDIPTRKQILNGIRRALVPGGWLLLGSSETTYNIDEQFVRRSAAGATAYQNPVEGSSL